MTPIADLPKDSPVAMASQSSMHTLSPVSLNNRDVVLAEAGMCKDAALCFKKASRMMMSVITQQHTTQAMTMKKYLLSPAPDSKHITECSSAYKGLMWSATTQAKKKRYLDKLLPHPNPEPGAPSMDPVEGKNERLV